MERFDVLIVGAGAAGLMCGIEAARRGRRVLIVEHNAKPAEKIRISGGGRCNFTNLNASGGNYLSQNRKFMLSALSRFTPRDFLGRVEAHGIAWHEKAQGQLFCDGSAQQIIDMLVGDLTAAGGVLRCGVAVGAVRNAGDGFMVEIDGQTVGCASLVIASGGKSIPKMGASPFGYAVAEQFGLPVIETRPGLVPLTFDPHLLAETAPLAGVAVDARVVCGKAAFEEALLFTHRGLSGPAILQISNHWRPGEALTIDLAPGGDMLATLKAARAENGRREPVSVLDIHLPKRLAQAIAGPAQRLADMGDRALGTLAARVNAWVVKPTGTEGYRTAEVTLGGIDTSALDARTMAAKAVPGLFFIGEVVDVTGWLGGYNFQWAWSSGWVAGQSV